MIHDAGIGSRLPILFLALVGQSPNSPPLPLSNNFDETLLRHATYDLCKLGMVYRYR